MKKLLAIFYLFFFLVFDFGCSACRSCARTCAFKSLDDNLFNKLVLRFYDVPWLKKPEVLRVKSTERGESSSHTYQAYLQGEQDFWEYGEYIYDKLVDKDYTIGAKPIYRSTGELFSFESWTLVQKPTSFEDCCKRNLCK